MGQSGELRASDNEREETVELLRRHHYDGRLTSEEFEERADEAWRARFRSELFHALRELPGPQRSPVPQAPRFVQPSPGDGGATTALVLGIVACCLLVFSMGMLFPLIAPLGGTAWVVGRRARRRAPAGRRSSARAGEVLGAVATIASLTAMLGWLAIFMAAAV